MKRLILALTILLCAEYAEAQPPTPLDFLRPSIHHRVASIDTFMTVSNGGVFVSYIYTDASGNLTLWDAVNVTPVALSSLIGGGGSSAFSSLSTGVNTTATMTVGTGSTITFSGSGINNASQYRGITAVSADEFSGLDGLIILNGTIQAQLDDKSASDHAHTFASLTSIPTTVAGYGITDAVPTARTITIAGTANQITSSAGAQDLAANRTWTLSLPQNIHTAATPIFAGMTLNGQLSVVTDSIFMDDSFITPEEVDPSNDILHVGSEKAGFTFQVQGDFQSTGAADVGAFTATSVASSGESSYYKHGGWTTTQRDALTPANGWWGYNITTDKFNFYEGGWVAFEPLGATSITASNLGGGVANFSGRSVNDLQFNSFNSTHFSLGSNLLSLNSTFLTTIQGWIRDSILVYAVESLTQTWSVMDTVKVGGESLPGWKVPYAITITEISAYTDANTVTFNIEERAEATPNTAGTDAMAADLVADSDQQEQTSFSNAGFAKDTWMVPTVTSASGSIAVFSITVRYTVAP